MNLRYACLFLTACTVAWTATAYAQSNQPVVKFPTEIEFKAPLSPGSQTAVLYGDPTKPGVYVQRTKFSPKRASIFQAEINQSPVAARDNGRAP